MKKFNTDCRVYRETINGRIYDVALTSYTIEISCKKFTTALSNFLKHFSELLPLNKNFCDMDAQGIDCVTDIEVNGVYNGFWTHRYEIVKMDECLYCLCVTTRECTPFINRIAVDNELNSSKEEEIAEQFGETDTSLSADHAREYMPLDANLLNMFTLANTKIPEIYHHITYEAICTKEYKLRNYNEEWNFWHEMERLNVPCANKIFLKIADYVAELADGKKKEHDSHCSTSISGVKDLDNFIEDMRKHKVDIDKEAEISLRKVCKMYRYIAKRFYSKKCHNIANALEMLRYYAENDCSDIPVVIFKKEDK